MALGPCHSDALRCGVILVRVARTLFTVMGARDVESERRSWLLLVLSTVVLLQLVTSMPTVPAMLTGAALQTWSAVVPLGVPAMLAVFLLARRGHAAAAARVFSAYTFIMLAVIAWAEGPNGNRMSVVILGIVGVGAVLRARPTALFALALLAVVAGLAVAEAAGVYAPLATTAAPEPPYLPFVRQSLALGLLVYALRRGYDRLRAQVADRERSRAATVQAARMINASLETMVSERTSTLAATRDRMSALAAHLADDLTANLDALRRQLGELATAGGVLGPDAGHYVTRAKAAAERLAVMTRRLHEHARLGTSSLRRAAVDIDAIARDVIEEFRRASGEPAIEWQIDTLPAAWTDPTLVRTVVENLISNAVKFSRPRRPPRIHVGFDAARGYFVRDNGVGFDPRHAAALFSPFHRLHADTAFEGYGLGLANVRRILRHLGGEISAEAEVERGATFWFRLPPSDEAA
jgi:signal transduction histidine kinase